MADKQIQTFNAIITRQRKITRRELEFEEYTDWVSDAELGRIDPSIWGIYLVTANGAPIITSTYHKIEVIQNANTNADSNS